LLLVIAGLIIIGVIFGIRLLRQVNFAGFVGLGRPASLRVPPGFSISTFAEGLASPRFIVFDSQGNLFVAERGAGRITVLQDSDGDGTADQQIVFAEGLPGVHSLAFFEGDWYAGVPSGVVRLRDADGDLQADLQQTVVDDIPTTGHNTRTVAFLPDGRMVLSVGSSCNVCEEDDPRRAAVLVYEDASGGESRIFAGGLRNAVGLALQPETGRLWVSNNGRDMLGDDLPPETVYELAEGGNYGWPFCHSGRIEDPDMGFPGSCEGVGSPVVEMQAHSAPLGIAFYTGQAFPQEYRGDLFIAFHGSWNRSVPTGYKVVRLDMGGIEPAGRVEDFVWGWLEPSWVVTGRPVGLAVGPDGGLYISDDFNGRVFRVDYPGH